MSRHDGVPMTLKNRSRRAFVRVSLRAAVSRALGVVVVGVRVPRGPVVVARPGVPTTSARGVRLRRAGLRDGVVVEPEQRRDGQVGGQRVLLLPLQELAEDAPQRPDVHRPGVFPVAHDHLRRAVARRRDDGREHIAPREGSERRLRVALAVEILRRGEGRERRLVRSRAKPPRDPRCLFLRRASLAASSALDPPPRRRSWRRRTRIPTCRVLSSSIVPGVHPRKIPRDDSEPPF